MTEQDDNDIGSVIAVIVIVLGMLGWSIYLATCAC